MAKRFNALSPAAVRDSKRLMRAGSREAIARAIQAENAAFAERLQSPEARAALQGFLHKRKPETGRG
jgi:enoyl-CoA hydratase/carnithine racemase